MFSETWLGLLLRPHGLVTLIHPWYSNSNIIGLNQWRNTDFNWPPQSWGPGDTHGTCSHFHNILRLSDVLPNFPFTTSETIRDYYI